MIIIMFWTVKNLKCRLISRDFHSELVMPTSEMPIIYRVFLL